MLERGIEVLEWHLLAEYIHICISTPLKYNFEIAMGFVKCKSVVRIQRQLLEKTV
jgi:putative transposase